MEPNEPQLEVVAKRRVQARIGLFFNLALYATVNIGLILIWSLTGRGYPWFVWPLFGWGVALVLHAVALWIGPDSSVEERAVQREIQRLRARGMRDEPHR